MSAGHVALGPGAGDFNLILCSLNAMGALPQDESRDKVCVAIQLLHDKWSGFAAEATPRRL